MTVQSMTAGASEVEEENSWNARIYCLGYLQRRGARQGVVKQAPCSIPKSCSERRVLRPWARMTRQASERGIYHQHEVKLQ